MTGTEAKRYMLVCHPADAPLVRLRAAGTGLSVQESAWVPRNSVLRVPIQQPEFADLPDTVEEWRAYFSKEQEVVRLLFECYIGLGHAPREAARMVLERLCGMAPDQQTAPEANR